MRIDPQRLKDIIEQMKKYELHLADIALKIGDIQAAKALLEKRTSKEYATLAGAYAKDDNYKTILQTLIEQIKDSIRSKVTKAACKDTTTVAENAYKMVVTDFFQNYGISIYKMACEKGAVKNARYLAKILEENGIVAPKIELSQSKIAPKEVDLTLCKGIIDYYHASTKKRLSDAERLFSEATGKIHGALLAPTLKNLELHRLQTNLDKIKTEAGDTSKLTEERMLLLQEAKKVHAEIKQFIEDNTTALDQENLGLYCLQDIYNINDTHNVPLFTALEEISSLPCWGVTGDNNLISSYNEAYTRTRKQHNDRSDLLYKGLKICDRPGILDVHKGNLYYNLGISCLQIDPEQALKYFSESEKYLPGDKDPILNKCEILANFSRKVEYDLESIKIQDPRLKVMLEILYIYRNQKSFEDLLNDKAKESLWNDLKKDPIMLQYIHDIIYREACYKNDKDTIITTCINSITEHPGHSGYLSKALLALYDLNELDAALTLLGNVQKMHPEIYENGEKDIVLEYAEFMIYEGLNHFELSRPKLEYINFRYAQSPDSIILKLIYEKANLKHTTNATYNKDFEEALKYVDNIGEDSATYKKYIELLRNEEQKAQIVHAHDIQETSAIAIEAAESALVPTEITDGATAEHILDQKIPLPKEVSSFAHMMSSGILDTHNLSPKLIEAYFRYQKSLHSPISDISASTTKWNIKDIGELVYHRDSIVKLDFPHHYAMLDPTLKIDKSLELQFTTALETKRIARKEGQSGVKFLNGKLAELKIYAETRTYTDTLYKNKNGDYLIIFNKLGNHHDVSTAIQKSSGINIIDSDIISTLEDSDHNKPDIQDTVQSYYNDVCAALGGEVMMHTDSLEI